MSKASSGSRSFTLPRVWQGLTYRAIVGGVFSLIASQFGLAAAADAAPCTLAGLHWLKGAWRYEGGGNQDEAVWTGASENRLIGSAWSLHASAPGGVIEASTIQIESKSVTLHVRHFTADLGLAREDTDQPLTYTATACADGSVTFDGQGAAHGSRVLYHRDGDKLTVDSDSARLGKPGRIEIAYHITIE